MILLLIVFIMIHYDSLENNVLIYAVDPNDKKYPFKTARLNHVGYVMNMKNSSANGEEEIFTFPRDNLESLGINLKNLSKFLKGEESLIGLDPEGVTYSYSRKSNTLIIELQRQQYSEDNDEMVKESIVIDSSGKFKYKAGDSVSLISEKNMSKKETINLLQQKGFKIDPIKKDIENIDDSLLTLVKILANQGKKDLKRKLGR